MASVKHGLLTNSGLLNEDDNGTDLGELERRLAEKNQSRRTSAAPASSPGSTEHSTQHGDNGPTPRSALASPEPQSKDGEKTDAKSNGDKTPREGEGVEELSDMMCSLVTNNCGETRYIGIPLAELGPNLC